jgi:predicted transcriptional regulator
MTASFYFDPSGKGLTVFLGPTEARLLELTWEHGPLTVKKAVFLWKESPKPAYTTVMTVLARLAEKGLLERVKQGKSYMYRPVFDRRGFLEDRLARVLTCLRSNFPETLKSRQ